jgi:hypothetical protein
LAGFFWYFICWSANFLKKRDKPITFVALGAKASRRSGKLSLLSNRNTATTTTAVTAALTVDHHQHLQPQLPIIIIH